LEWAISGVRIRRFIFEIRAFLNLFTIAGDAAGEGRQHAGGEQDTAFRAGSHRWAQDARGPDEKGELLFVYFSSLKFFFVLLLTI
jgi:hypothetical protein